jgi:response regulator RpfG family c-di-GMP phosphodiesterase
MIKLIRSALHDMSFRVDADNLRSRAEQLRVRLKTYPLLVISQALLQLLFVVLLWGGADHYYLLSWLACTYLFHAWELLKWRYDRDKITTVKECRQWSRHFTQLALAVGLLWGSAFMFFFPVSLDQQVLLVCLMLALAAGSVTMISVHTPSTYAYLLGVMLPLTFRVMAENDEAHWVITYLLLLFLVVIVASGRELRKMVYLSLNQRFENLALVEQLTQKKELLEKAKQEVEASNELLRSEGKLLEKLVRERTAELLAKSEEVVAIQDVMILAMCSLSETRDNETGNHIKRTQNYVRALAKHLQSHPRFREFLSDENVEALYKVAPLHDIGKVGIPDAILLKPGKLTPEEFEVMKTHTTLGGNAIADSEDNFQLHNNKFLVLARQIATGHHEKWDGSGYPKGLKGEEIPIAARLMALADVYDALVSRRIYKEGFSQELVTELIVAGRGQHFDPDIVDAYLTIHPEFLEIAQRFHD